MKTTNSCGSFIVLVHKQGHKQAFVDYVFATEEEALERAKWHTRQTGHQAVALSVQLGFAAPDLLKALECYMSGHPCSSQEQEPDTPTNCPTLLAARTAIALAQGTCSQGHDWDEPTCPECMAIAKAQGGAA